MHSADQNTALTAPRTVVAENSCYMLEYDSVANRVYLIISGFWKSKSVVSEYIPNIKKTLQLIQPGFTLLADLRNMITHPQSVMGLHIECLALLKEAGLTKGASITPPTTSLICR